MLLLYNIYFLYDKRLVIFLFSDHLFKIVIIGNAGVGKSSLLTRYSVILKILG